MERTVIITAQSPDGALGTARISTNLPLSSDAPQFISGLQHFYQDLGYDVLSVTKIEESHSTEVLSWDGRGYRARSSVGSIVANLTSAGWWKSHIWLAVAVLLLTDLLSTGSMYLEYRCLKRAIASSSQQRQVEHGVVNQQTGEN